MTDPASSRDDLIRDWYEHHYNTVTASADGSVFQRYLHTTMERGFGTDASFPRVLEVGGNRGEHVQFVKHRFSSYVLSDLYEPALPADAVDDPRFALCTCDAASIPFAEGAFNRVIVTCVMHHVDDPLVVFRELRRVAADNAIVTLLLPTDPGFLYRAGVWLTSRRAAKREGLVEDMYLLKAVDHRNHYRSLAAQARYAFAGDQVKIAYLPFRVPSVECNAFTVWQVRIRKG